MRNATVMTYGKCDDRFVCIASHIAQISIEKSQMKLKETHICQTLKNNRKYYEAHTRLFAETEWAE